MSVNDGSALSRQFMASSPSISSQVEEFGGDWLTLVEKFGLTPHLEDGATR